MSIIMAWIYRGPEGEVSWPTLDGTVIYTGFDPNHGNVIQIQHKNGFISVYKHTNCC